MFLAFHSSWTIDANVQLTLSNAADQKGDGEYWALVASGPSEDPDNSVGNIHDLIQFDSFTTIPSDKKSEMMSIN